MSTININVSRADMGLDQVDNTSDLNKPISTATQTALDDKVDKVVGERLITSAEATILGNISGTNTGDQDLQSVTDIGNTTTDNIAFTGAVGVLFDNTSTLRKGTIDAGYGGAKGVAQICAVGYELKWEAGRLYVMGDGGTTIREVSHNFTTTPAATDDNTKGFIVGSRWILDNGDLYICSDVTTATAVWTLQTIDAVPTDGSTKAVESNGVFDALALKVDTVVGSRLITSAESTLIGNTSGVNSGDETITTIKTKLGITTLSGSNTGDQDLSGYALDSAVVKLTGTQSVGGIKTFTSELKLNDKLYLSETASPAATTGYTTLTSNGSQFVLQNGSNTAAATFVFNGARTYTLPNITGTLLSGANNLSDLTNTTTARTNLGLGSLATQSGTFSGTSSGTNTGDQTFLNARVQTVTSSATVTPTSTNDLVIITAQATGLTLANPTGTFTEGQALMIRIKDNATARTIAFDTNYRAIGVTLPTTTVISKTMYLGIIYNSTDAKWDIVGYNLQA